MTADNVNLEASAYPGNETGSGGLRSALSAENIRSFLASAKTDDKTSNYVPDVRLAVLEGRTGNSADSRSDARRDATAAVPKTEREVARDQLLSSADKFIKNPDQRAQFKRDVASLEARGSSDKIDDKEVTKAFENINRLFTLPQKGSVPHDSGAQLAREVMRHAAKPSTIDQGDNHTCNVTTVENIVYSKQPGEAAKLVADVATTGSYTATDGTKVTIDRQSLQPDPEARLTERKNGERTYATQLFNVTSVNLHYQKNKPNIHYEIHPSTKHTKGGERLMDHSKSPPERMRNCKGHLDQPYLDDDEIVGVYEMISGKSGNDIYLGHKDYTDPKTGKRLTTFTSEQELKDKLVELKRDGKLPILLSVNTAVQPFFDSAGGGSPKRYEGEHVIVVRDIEPGPPTKIAVDDQMGEKGDRLGAKMLSLENVYLASLPTPKAVEHLEKQIQDERKRGIRDARKAAELNRLKQFTPAKVCPEEQ